MTSSRTSGIKATKTVGTIHQVTHQPNFRGSIVETIDVIGMKIASNNIIETVMPTSISF